LNFGPEKVFEPCLYFFPAYSFKTIPEDLKIITLSTPSYNVHQQLFVLKLIHYLQVIGRELQYPLPTGMEKMMKAERLDCLNEMSLKAVDAFVFQ